MWKMFLSYDKKDKRKFILAKGFIFIFIGMMAYLATHFSKIELPELKHQISFGLGFLLILVVVILALLNRLQSLFKIRSIGFLLVFLILLLFRYTIDTLVITTGLTTIPLLIDDVVINPYFKYINMNKYWEKYKYIGSRDA